MLKVLSNFAPRCVSIYKWGKAGVVNVATSQKGDDDNTCFPPFIDTHLGAKFDNTFNIIYTNILSIKMIFHLNTENS